MNKMKVVIIAFIAYVAYSFLVDGLFALINDVHLSYSFTTPSIKQILKYVIIVPIWEEAVFRYAPIEICRELHKKLNIDVTLPVCIMFSLLIFAYGHPGSVMSNMMYQGVFGLLCCFIYIKNGWSYWSTVILHASWNLLMCIIIN